MTRTSNRTQWVLLAVLLAGCGKPPAPAGPGDMPGMPGMAASAGSDNTGGIKPSAAAAAIMGLTVAPVRAGVGQVPRRAPASVTFDPTASVRVTSQSGGQIRSLTVPAQGEPVTRGQVLALLYDPGQRAILEEVRVAQTLGEPWRSAAASRARASGISEAQIRAVLDGGAVPDTFPVRAPTSGIVSSRPASEGAWLAPGGVVAILVDPDAVLVDLVVDGAPPSPGAALALRDAGADGVRTAATVTAVLPEATAAGVRVRVKPLRPVTPGRPLVAEWMDVTPPSLWVPSSALVDTGTRRVVFVQTETGFVPRAVEPGVRAGDEIEILAGLAAGESVASGAAFLLDSETQIAPVTPGPAAAPAMSMSAEEMKAMPGMTMPPAAAGSAR